MTFLLTVYTGKICHIRNVCPTAPSIPLSDLKYSHTSFRTVNYIYKKLGGPKDSYSALQQTGVSFLGGYIAGIGCATISHPADVMVSKLNANKEGK